jgi:protein-S-isoprenylcysteine O-methyltransferase Ste14
VPKTLPSDFQKPMARVLVAFQFGFSALLILSTSGPYVSWRSPLASLLIAVGAGVAVWAWLTMGLRRIRIMPQPAETAELTTRGPYRWVRHPMYSGLIAALLGVVILQPTVGRAMLWLAVVLVLGAKAQIEERLLLNRFPNYSAYRQKSWRFFPGLY